MGKKKLFFRAERKLEPPNVFIGGVGADYITSIDDLFALTTNLNKDNTENFKIDVNNNVSFYISVNLGWTTGNPFNGVSSLTYIVYMQGGDFHGGAHQTFTGCANLKYMYSAGGWNIHNHSSYRRYHSLASLRAMNVDLNTNFKQPYTFSGVNSLRKVDFRNCTDITPVTQENLCRIMSSLERFNMKKATNIPTNLTRYNPMFQSTKVGAKIYYNSVFGVMDRNSHLPFLIKGDINVGDTITVNGLVYTAVTGIPVNEGEFNVDDNRNSDRTNFRNAVNADNRVGILGKVTCIMRANWSENFAFLSDQLGVVGDSITASSTSNQVTFPNGNTFFGGHDIHPTLAYVRDSYGAILVEGDVDLPVNKPTGLAYGNITETTVDLLFTEPTPNAYGNDGYEVWVDDGTIYRGKFDYGEITGSGATLDLSEVVNDINGSGSIIGSKIKIRTIDGQYNFSEFSNEILLTI